MIILNNLWSSHGEFVALNNEILNYLESDLEKNPGYYPERGGIKFEEDVLAAAVMAAKNTAFEGRIEQVSGQKFPDIVAKVEALGGYGIEVKTTGKNHWTSTGSSIFEGTRVEGIGRISMMFAKLADPVEFRWRPYEECLSNVAITHSPRYLIDMNATETIFDRIGIPYDELRMLENPFRPIKEHFRRKVLQPGQDVWWADPADEASSLVIRHFSDLPKGEKDALEAQSIVFFPNVFSDDNKLAMKQISAWLASRHGLLNHSLRDRYSSGGRELISVHGKSYDQIPKIFKRLQSWTKASYEFLMSVDQEYLEEYWGKVSGDDRLEQWLALVIQSAGDYSKKLPLEAMIREQIDP